MRLSTKGRYAVMAMVDLAQQGMGQPTSLAEIAERQEISLSYLEQLFAMLRKAVTNETVKVAPMEGLLVEFAASQSAHAVVRGLRAISDFEFEFQMALMNRKLDPDIETIFLMPKEEYSYLSSRIVK